MGSNTFCFEGKLTLKGFSGVLYVIVHHLFQIRIKDINKLDDISYNLFVQRLIEYFKPSSKMYGDVELRPEVLPLNLFTLALFDLIDDLMDAPNVSICCLVLT